MLTEAAPAVQTRFLRIHDVLDRVPISKPTLYRMMKKSEFPKAVHFGSASFWVEHEINKWLNDKLAAR